jgi:hypothetical protein
VTCVDVQHPTPLPLRGRITHRRPYPIMLALVSGVPSFAAVPQPPSPAVPPYAKNSTVRITNKTSQPSLYGNHCGIHIMIHALTLVDPVLVRRRRRSENSKLLSFALFAPCAMCLRDLRRSVTVAPPILSLVGQTYASTKQNVHNRVGNIFKTSALHLFTKHADGITDSESRKNPRRKSRMDGPRSPRSESLTCSWSPLFLPKSRGNG